jgi:type II secretory pathway pseudopilin PulG
MNPVLPMPRARATGGMTLMEVLIACGILVVGLSSLAALLPAAGARLGQANLEDRAGTLAANAYTDVVTRGLVAADLFGDHTKSLAFGQGLSSVAASQTDHFATRTDRLTARIDPQRGFLLEDEVLYAPPITSVTPVNEFLQGRRSFKEAICWGATLVPDAFPADADDLPGTRAKLSIAVFRKPPEPTPIPLEVINGLYRMNPPNEALMKKFLRSCSHVLVPPRATATDAGPRWFRVTASWIAPFDPVTKQRLDDNCYVLFDDITGPGGESISSNDFADPTPAVIGFDGIVRLDEYNVILK